MFGATVMSSGIDSSPALLTTPSLSSLTSSSSELSSSSSSFSKELYPSQPMARQPQWVKSDGSNNQRCALQRSAKSSSDPRSHGRGKCDRPKVTSQSERSEPKRGRSSTCSRETFTAPVPVLLALTFPMDDSSIEDSEQASAASTVPLLITLLSLLPGLKARFTPTSTEEGPGLYEQLAIATILYHGHRPWKAFPAAASSLSPMYQSAYEGRSRWLNGLCRCLHSGCTNGTGPRPYIEP